MRQTVELLIICYSVLMNLLTFIVFGIDKYRARRNRYRISERFLLIMGLLGGSIGAWLGMYLFRHKTRHIVFVIGIPGMVIMHIGLIIYMNIH